MGNIIQVSKATYAKNKLEDYALLAERELNMYFSSELNNIFGVNRKEKELSRNVIEHIKDYVLRPAKRSRASFVYYGYKLLNDVENEEVIKASMSVELIHAGLLIHDDFMDQDTIRRGKPTTHNYYSTFHNNSHFIGNAKHYGESMSVNVGDIALLLGYQILGKVKFPPERIVRAQDRLCRGIVNTALGQVFDITLEQARNATERDILDLHWAKTSIYTYENPLHVGAILAGADRKDLEIITKYAIPGGIAFQLQDDILGLFGDTQKTGKSSYSDLKEGKMTLLAIEALRRGSKTQNECLRKILGKRDLTEAEAIEARKIVQETGSLEYSKQASVRWAKKAQSAIKAMKAKKWNSEAIDYLDGIAQYMIEREM